MVRENPSEYETGIVTRRIPVLGKVSAGFPDTIASETIDWIAVPAMSNDALALRIKGDSMLPKISNGIT